MKTLIIDNYDSFTYNLVEMIRQCGVKDMDVVRNDQITVSEVEAYDRIVISPGPGVPSDAGIINEVIGKLAPRKKILGICLGMQAMGEVFGSDLTNLDEVFHGKATMMERLDQKELLFKGMPQKMKVGRYHSWGIMADDVSDSFKLLAKDDNNIAMAIRHKSYDLVGLQFHPESVLTDNGRQIMSNWLESYQSFSSLVLPTANSAAYDLNRIERTLFL
ncbi:MAG: aminodeoxychorismate/anthranilate synthase component II [Salinivirgaceae bacterium]|nr:MAG: aminodeoxychorismate/anthranilate synthase component II [Salinivirgaceae bacterium]